MSTEDSQPGDEDLARELLAKLDCTSVETTSDGWLGSGPENTYRITTSGLRRYVQQLTAEDAAATFPDAPRYEAALRLLSTSLSSIAATSTGTVELDENAGTVATRCLDPEDLNPEECGGDPHDNYWSASPTGGPE